MNWWTTKRAFAASLAILCISFIACGTQAQTREHHDQTRRLETLLEGTAQALSEHIAADADARAVLAERLKSSPRKYVIMLRRFLDERVTLAREQGGDTLAVLAARVLEAEAAMRALGQADARLDLKLPVKAHRDRLSQTVTPYVGVVPSTDETHTKSIVAFREGKRVTLDAQVPPDVPTLIVTPAESSSTDPHYPLRIVDEPAEDEEFPGRIVDDFVGIRWIRLLDDHESWVSGDPELYVRITRCSGGSFSQVRINLPGVNDENVWYRLNDPNATYRFVNCGSHVFFDFYEADSGAHGGDDFVGSCNVRWRDLPFSGYRPISCFADIRIWVDRD